MAQKKCEAATAAPAYGDWFVIEGSAERREMSRIVKKDDHDYLIAYVLTEWLNPHQRAEDLANAHVMSRAPKLLAACERAEAMLGELQRHLDGGRALHCRNVLETLRAAISDAKGGA